MAARRDDIRTIRNSRAGRARLVEAVEGPPTLISRDAIGQFRAVRAPASLDGDEIRLSVQTAAALGVVEGEPIRVAL
jgi:arginine/ornithine N-succinyltransferase beta subunit